MFYTPKLKFLNINKYYNRNPSAAFDDFTAKIEEKNTHTPNLFDLQAHSLLLLFLFPFLFLYLLKIPFFPVTTFHPNWS